MKIDREDRTNNAMAHPASCRGDRARMRRLATLYRPSERWLLMKAAIVSTPLRDWLLRTRIVSLPLTLIMSRSAICMSTSEATITRLDFSNEESLNMKILVPVKRVVDANAHVRVKADGSGVDLSGVKMSINPFD